MSDYRDVMTARQDARDALGSCEAYGGSIEDGRTGDVSLALMLAAGALCAELRSLAVLLDYTLHETIPRLP